MNFLEQYKAIGSMDGKVIKKDVKQVTNWFYDKINMWHMPSIAIQFHYLQTFIFFNQAGMTF